MPEQSIRSRATAQRDACLEASTTGPLVMVVTLKSGVQIRTQVTEYSVGRGGLSDQMTSLKWSFDEDGDSRLRYVDLAEVVAVHSEWPEAVTAA